MNKDLQLNPLLEELLCCPACKDDSTLERPGKAEKLVCSKCSREFVLKAVPGKDGKGMLIPSLLLED
ncbi:MAG: hypothetical protein MK132_03370 [Lentisphaerales bacterium]|nr:hypothetical protein [Lentisphaerales bacterium]